MSKASKGFAEPNISVPGTHLSVFSLIQYYCLTNLFSPPWRRFLFFMLLADALSSS